MNTQVTAETIREAHAREIHPSNSPVTWNFRELDREPWSEDTTLPDRGMLLRITYSNGRGGPSESADYAMSTAAGDADIRDAQDISRHSDVYAVQIYAADENGIMTSGVPLAVIVDGKIEGTF